jgi:predicted DNA-binding transcriptional regulator YafY
VRTERIDGEDQAGYRIVGDEYFLPELHLETDESEALAFALAAVRLEGGGIGDIAAKLGVRGVPTLSPIAVLPSLPVLALLQQALRDRAKVSFAYHGRTREVSGYGLVFKDGSWYFVGLDHTAGEGGELRTFRADRIGGEPTLGAAGAYEIPPGFSARDELRAAPFGSDLESATTVVEIAVAPRSAGSVLGIVGTDAVSARSADGSVTLSFRVADEDAILSYLLGLGEDVEVLAPKVLRDRIASTLAEVVAARSMSARR